MPSTQEPWKAGVAGAIVDVEVAEEPDQPSSQEQE